MTSTQPVLDMETPPQQLGGIQGGPFSGCLLAGRKKKNAKELGGLLRAAPPSLIEIWLLAMAHLLQQGEWDTCSFKKMK